jgi:hypothetical protein
MRYWLAILFALTIVIRESSAEPKNITMGFGNHSCAQFGADMKKDPDAEGVYFIWAQGFLTAFHAFFVILNRPLSELEKVSQPQLKADIRTYCNKNPLSTYSKLPNAVARNPSARTSVTLSAELTVRG